MNARAGVSALALCGAMMALGCHDDSVGATATPGRLRVELTTPNSGLDGAAVLILNGPAAPRAVTAGAGLTLWGGPVQTAQATVALTGVLSSATILLLDVDAVELADQYSVTIREVSDNDSTVALRNLTGYALTVVP
jgi:hypothetical protein